MSRSQSRSRQPSPLSKSRRPRPTEDTILGSDGTAIHAGRSVVITGAASGIGLAAAKKFAKHGMHVCLADINADGLKEAEAKVAQIIPKDNILSVVTDVSSLDQVERLRDEAMAKFGEINVLLHAAAIGKAADGSTGTAFENIAAWKQVMDVNLGGTINIVQTFTIPMCSQENPGAIILTGSKQGITNPPGNAAYNASKAAVKSIAENLAHELRNRNAHTTAHLFVPGWTWTQLAGASGFSSKPEGAWTPEETVRYMFDRVRYGDFYIVCPDGETSSEMDRYRIQWAAGDIYENRPALSRWHPEWAPIYQEYIRDSLAQEENDRASNHS